LPPYPESRPSLNLQTRVRRSLLSPLPGGEKKSIFNVKKVYTKI